MAPLPSEHIAALPGLLIALPMSPNDKPVRVETVAGTTPTSFGWWGVGALALLLFVAAPLVLDSFRLGLVGKYLTFAFAAIGIVLI